MKPTRGILDPEKMAYFIELDQGSPDFFLKLAHTYLETSRKLLAEFDKAVEPSKAVYLGHQIKDLSENIGARKMEAMGESIESLAQAGKMRELAAVIAEAKKVFLETETSLKLLMDGRKTG